MRDLALVLVIAFTLIPPVQPAAAAFGDCGQPISNGGIPSVGDALYVLQGGVGLVQCDLCLCDLNGSGGVSVSDALIDLNGAVGLTITYNCPPCETTTTTLGNCPPANALDDVEYKEKYSCAQSTFGGPYQCVDLNVLDRIRFVHQGGGEYDVRDVPDNGFLLTGTLNCLTFDWDASSPNGYTETGTWEFSSNLLTFTGSSSYEADDQSYEGNCLETGAKSPTVPPDTAPFPPCP